MTSIPAGYLVKASGRAGGPESEHFEEQLAGIVARKPALIVLDLSGLEYLSSMGISALIRLQRAMKEIGGKVRLAGVPAPIMTLFQAAKIDTLIPVFHTAEDALK
jgi:anti-sigma B factor antagonist